MPNNNINTGGEKRRSLSLTLLFAAGYTGRYMDKEIKINYILSILGIKRSRFFELMNRYRKDPDNFSIQYNIKTINRKIYQDIETNTIKELNTEKDLIKAKGVSIRL